MVSSRHRNPEQVTDEISHALIYNIRMLKLFSLAIYILIVPASFGLLYELGLRPKEWIIMEIWTKGWALMLAFFSLLYWLCHVLGVEWHEDIWRTWCLVIICVAIVVTIVALTSRKKKSIAFELTLVRKELYPVYIMVTILFVLSFLLLRRTDYEHHMEQYIWIYNTETIGMKEDMTEEILLELKESLFQCDMYVFYLTINKLIRMGADKFLTVIMAFSMMLLSVTSYDFIGERLNVDREKRHGFLMLIYAVYIVTVFCAEYHLYAIYNYLWEPVTAYVTVFLPFQLGMMLYIQETIIKWETGITKSKSYKKMNKDDKHRLYICLVWTVGVFLIGHMFTWKESIILLAPEMAGVVTGLIIRAKRRGAERGSFS